MAEGCCEVQRGSSLRVSTQSRGSMFQQSRYTVLTAQHGLQEEHTTHDVRGIQYIWNILGLEKERTRDIIKCTQKIIK